MYAKNKVEERIERAERHLGFRLEYHSVSDIEDFAQRLERRHWDAYRAAQQAMQASESSKRAKVYQTTLLKLIANAGRLSKAEVRWMQNERALVSCDAAYFLEHYYWIINTENNLQLFNFAHRPGQEILFGCLGVMEALNVSLELLDAKARQLGVSTEMAGLQLQKICFQPGVNSVIASADSPKTREMVRKILGAYDKLPWWMRPVYSRRVESDQGFIYFGDSGVTFQHGEQTNPIAMGNTVIGYHLSEVSSYPNPEELIEMGLFKAVHPSPRVLGVLESTCKGNTGWWHDYYWFCKSKWKQGLSRLMALFLPFYCATNMYPNPTELLAHPIPRGWKPEDETQRMMRESEAYVQSNDVLAKVLMKDGRQWKMSREQAWYWEWNFLEARAKGEEKLWYQEMPHTDRVAFQSSYESVFGKEIIATVESSRESKYHVYGLTGQSIEECHEPDPDEVDHKLEIIPIRYTNRRNMTYNWSAIPLEWVEPFEAIEEIRDDESHMGKLFIWKHPEPVYDYSIGIRTSNGINTDPTVIAVSRRARHKQDHDIQVAEFRDIGVSHVEAFAWGMAIAAYYGKFMLPEFGMLRHREPYIAIEQVRSVGDTCQLQMQKMGYRRFHRMTRYDSKMEDMRKSKAKKLGWYSFGWAEPMLTDGFVVLVRNGWYQVNSPYTIWEMDHWEVHSTESGKDKYLPSEEATAHGLYANALAAFCPNDQKPLAERTMKQFMKTGYDTAKPELDMSPTLAGLTVSTITPPPDPRISRLTLMGK